LPSPEDILKALSEVTDPELGKDVVSLRMIDDLAIKDGFVSLTLRLTTPACPLQKSMEEEVRRTVAKLPGVKGVRIKVSSTVFATRDPKKGEMLERVKNVIAVASGKGGVGKSTVAVNLAVALAATGAKVGILDADIYGPNVPHMMGVKGNAEVRENVVVPPVAFGVKVASLGFFYRDETPLIWRGPLVAGAVRQLLTQVDWGELDYLVVDLPPSTGDAPLTLAQTVPLGGVVIVTTPQEAALSIAAKALAMFRRLDVPILGIVENMSFFVCPRCGEKTYVFSTGGGRRVAAQLDADFLGEIPLDVLVREQSDLGTPVVIAQPDSFQARVFKEFAFKVAGMVSIVAFSKMNRPSS
jgi:ATP-binding protein involved in chromosome partitioning